MVNNNKEKNVDTPRIGLHALMLKLHLIILTLFIAAVPLSPSVRNARF